MNTLPISGVCPLTTIDYPEHIAAVLFTQGCPYTCLYCHNGTLRPIKEGEIPWEKIDAFLQKRIGKLEAIVISGGEPTIHKGLPETLEYLQSLGFKTGLHTAGFSPKILMACTAHLNWVGLDVKAPTEGKYTQITGQRDGLARAAACIQILQETQIPHQVRTTLFPETIGEDEIENINKFLSQRNEPPTTVQSYRPA